MGSAMSNEMDEAMMDEFATVIGARRASKGSYHEQGFAGLGATATQTVPRQTVSHPQPVEAGGCGHAFDGATTRRRRPAETELSRTPVTNVEDVRGSCAADGQGDPEATKEIRP